MKSIVVKPGEKAPESRIYRCTGCHNLSAMFEGERAMRCEICEAKGRKQAWQATPRELLVKTRNVKRKFERGRRRSEMVADRITAFCGNLWFVYTHTIWFALWIAWNLWMPNPFDPYPFGLLTMIVSLEAIVLATFILLSQNREAQIADMRAELDYQVNIHADKRVEEILALVRDLHGGKKRKR